MATLHRVVLLGVLFSLLSPCLSSAEFATAFASGCAGTACKSSCTRNDVAPVVRLLAKYSTESRPVCADLLNRPAPGPATTTRFTTIRTTVTATNTEDVTVKNGISLAVVSLTSTSTLVDTATVSLASTATVTVTSSADATIFVTGIVTLPPPSTVTVTAFTAAPVYKRKQQGSLGDTYSGLPAELQDVDLDIARPACECLFKATTASTITVTKEVTAGATVTVQPYSTTIPSVTSTRTDVLAAFVTSTQTATVTDYTTLTVTEDITATKTNTETVTNTPPAATDTVYITVTYSGVGLPRNDCTYNRYYDYPIVSNNGDNNFQEGVRQCEALCTTNDRCKFFFVLHFDPNKARGYDGAGCILDDLPFDAQYLQCGYVNNFNVAYNKNP